MMELIYTIGMTIRAMVDPIVCAGLSFADEHAVGCLMAVVVVGVVCGVTFETIWKCETD